jgi:hypothetical protein
MQGAEPLERQDSDRPAATSRLRFSAECPAQFSDDLSPHPVCMLIVHSLPTAVLDHAIKLIVHIQHWQLRLSSNCIASSQLGEAIKRRDEGDETVQEIARSYNVHGSTISRLAA